MTAPRQREYVAAALLMGVSAVVTYVIVDQFGAAVISAACVGMSLMVARDL